jgi:hypothetical protein
MVKRTIKPAAGKSHITAAAARAAARVVYRDRATGRLVIVSRDASGAAASKKR